MYCLIEKSKNNLNIWNYNYWGAFDDLTEIKNLIKSSPDSQFIIIKGYELEYTIKTKLVTSECLEQLDKLNEKRNKKKTKKN